MMDLQAWGEALSLGTALLALLLIFWVGLYARENSVILQETKSRVDKLWEWFAERGMRVVKSTEIGTVNSPLVVHECVNERTTELLRDQIDDIAKFVGERQHKAMVKLFEDVATAYGKEIAARLIPQVTQDDCAAIHLAIAAATIRWQRMKETDR